MYFATATLSISYPLPQMFNFLSLCLFTNKNTNCFWRENLHHSSLCFSVTITLITLLTPVVYVCFFFLPHQEILWHQEVAPQCNSVMTLVTWRKCHLPQMSVSVPQDCAHFFRCQLQAHVVVCVSDWSAVSWGFLLEWLTELREILVFICLFSSKGCR